MNARTRWGRALAAWMSIGVSQLAVPVVQAAPLPADRHAVDQSQVARRLLESARTREERVSLFQAALGTQEARDKARSLGADPDRLRAAVPHLSDRELADLATRASLVEQDVAAGHHGSGPEAGLIVLGVLLVVTGIAVLIAVAGDSEWDDDWDDCDCYY